MWTFPPPHTPTRFQSGEVSGSVKNGVLPPRLNVQKLQRPQPPAPGSRGPDGAADRLSSATRGPPGAGPGARMGASSPRQALCAGLQFTACGTDARGSRRRGRPRSGGSHEVAQRRPRPEPFPQGGSVYARLSGRFSAAGVWPLRSERLLDTHAVLRGTEKIPAGPWPGALTWA